jgi:hypothetical protein
VVQTLFDEQANNAVGVEDEVGTVRVLVADDAARREGDVSSTSPGFCLANAACLERT